MELSLRHITQDDHQFLYDLLAERPAYANISHKAMPSFEEHCRFVNSKPYKKWYLIWARPDCGTDENTTQAGAVYLTHANEIGVSITKHYQGYGLGKMAVDALIHDDPTLEYLANIAPDNAVSKNLFESMGFKKIQETYKWTNSKPAGNAGTAASA